MLSSINSNEPFLGFHEPLVNWMGKVGPEPIDFSNIFSLIVLLFDVQYQPLLF